MKDIRNVNDCKILVLKSIFQCILSSYYGQDALLMDEERSSMLPMMAAGKTKRLRLFKAKNTIYIPIVKVLLSCVSLVESISREMDDIRLSPSYQHVREIMQ